MRVLVEHVVAEVADLEVDALSFGSAMPLRFSSEYAVAEKR